LVSNHGLSYYSEVLWTLFLFLPQGLVGENPVATAINSNALPNQRMPVDILILGAGWTSIFLIKLCDERGISHSATSRSGRDSTIKFEFDPESDDLEPYGVLPSASTVLITFPIDKPGASERLVRLYINSRRPGDSSSELKSRFIQLGATGMWDVSHLRFHPILPH